MVLPGFLAALLCVVMAGVLIRMYVWPILKEFLLIYKEFYKELFDIFFR